MGNRNPIEGVRFFDQAKRDTAFTMKPSHTSLLLPATFSEAYVRIFVKKDEHVGPAREAFKEYCRREKHISPTAANEKEYVLPQPKNQAVKRLAFENEVLHEKLASTFKRQKKVE